MKMIKICAQALNRWILTQKSTVKASDSRRNGMVATLLILSFGVATAFGLTPGTSLSPIPVSAVIEDITRDNLTPVETPGIYTQQDLARSGDTLASLLFRMGVDDRAALDFMRTNAIAKTIYQQMSPGKPIRVQKRANGDLISFGSAKLQFWLAPAPRRSLPAREMIVWTILALVTLGQMALLFWLHS